MAALVGCGDREGRSRSRVHRRRGRARKEPTESVDGPGQGLRADELQVRASARGRGADVKTFGSFNRFDLGWIVGALIVSLFSDRDVWVSIGPYFAGRCVGEFLLYSTPLGD